MSPVIRKQPALEVVGSVVVDIRTGEIQTDELVDMCTCGHPLEELEDQMRGECARCDAGEPDDWEWEVLKEIE